MHGEPRTARSEGAEEAQSLLSDHRSSLEKESVVLLLGETMGCSALMDAAMPGVRSWAVRAVSIGDL